MAKRKFSRSELDQHLESIEIFWHRHGGEQKGELIEYLEALFEALPRELHSDTVISAKDQIEVDLSLMEKLLKDALTPVYTEGEIIEEISKVSNRVIELGAVKDGSTLRSSSRNFDRAFQESFSAESLSDELVAETDEVRKRLFEGSKRSKIAGDLPSLDDHPRVVEIQYQDLLEGVDAARDWANYEVQENVDEFWEALEELASEGEEREALTLSASFFRERFDAHFLTVDEDDETASAEYTALSKLRDELTGEQAEDGSSHSD